MQGDMLLRNGLIRRAQQEGEKVPGAYRTNGHQVSKDGKHFAVVLLGSIQDHLHPNHTVSDDDSSKNRGEHNFVLNSVQFDDLLTWLLSMQLTTSS